MAINTLRGVNTSSPNFNENPDFWYDRADTLWMLLCAALVSLMIPAVGLLNSGLSGRESALRGMWLPVVTAAVVSVQWLLLGYSISFSSTGQHFSFLGGFQNSWFQQVHSAPLIYPTHPGGPRIPELVYALYQGMFASFTASLVSCVVVGRGKTLPFLIFIFIWSSIVYTAECRWTWSPQGWSYLRNVLDAAGGTAVHISSATAGATYCMFLIVFGDHHGQRPILPAPPAHNELHVILGTSLLAFGWLGFNGGSALGVNLRAIIACVSTVFSASFGGLTWCMISYYVPLNDNRKELSGDSEVPLKPRPRKLSLVSFSNGVVSGLVAITPAAGYVPVQFSPLFGVLGALFGVLSQGFFRYLLSSIKFKYRDDLDLFAIHGVVGFVGMICTGIFAKAEIARLDGYTDIKGGALDGNGTQQFKVQIADALAGMAYSACVTVLILGIMQSLAYATKHLSCFAPLHPFSPVYLVDIRDEDELEFEDLNV